MNTPDKAIYRFLDTNGDGSGTKNAIGDYSTPAEFYFQSQGEAYIRRMLIHITDASGGNAEEYGNLGAALTNGYLVRAMRGATVLLDLTDGIEIKNNGGLGRCNYDARPESSGSGDEFWNARWTFAKAGFPLYLAPGDKLSITLADDMTGLVEHYFQAQGYYE